MLDSTLRRVGRVDCRGEIRYEAEGIGRMRAGCASLVLPSPSCGESHDDIMRELDK